VWGVQLPFFGTEFSKTRLEGKEYVVRDGDVMHFRFAT
jgi:ribosome-binding ATPase YchF (GTP1/OBG family)